VFPSLSAVGVIPWVWAWGVKVGVRVGVDVNVMVGVKLGVHVGSGFALSRTMRGLSQSALSWLLPPFALTKQNKLARLPGETAQIEIDRVVFPFVHFMPACQGFDLPAAPDNRA
jgi:hypothetical protein